MIFIETPIFTEDVKKLLSDDEYLNFQAELTISPKSGNVIPGTGGLRKIRCSAKGKGKRGGVRIIYYYLQPDEQIRLILIYLKGVKDDLTEQQKKLLRNINKQW